MQGIKTYVNTEILRTTKERFNFYNIQISLEISFSRYADTAVTFMVTTKTTRNQFSKEVVEEANDRYRVRNNFYKFLLHYCNDIILSKLKVQTV